ncbi:hypothetical protein OG225_41485 (plasmid) [Nocardia sp. NBC_01377]|uniref:hypothetical protein n=1 Tax=Nocardia sp. NBC_01377 TaxID=2903595 RepID=UPI003247ECE9
MITQPDQTNCTGQASGNRIRDAAADRHDLTDVTDECPWLLTPSEAISAISGFAHRDARQLGAAAAVAVWARELSDLHASLLPVEDWRHPADFDERAIRATIEQIIAAINDFADAHLLAAHRVPKHSHGLGEVISQIAATFATAWNTVAFAQAPEARHREWTRLAQVREKYADLIADLAANRAAPPLQGSAVKQ